MQHKSCITSETSIIVKRNSLFYKLRFYFSCVKEKLVMAKKVEQLVKAAQCIKGYRRTRALLCELPTSLVLSGNQGPESSGCTASV